MKKYFTQMLFIFLIIFVSTAAKAAEKDYSGYIVKLKSTSTDAVLCEVSDSSSESGGIIAIDAERGLFRIDDIENLPDGISRKDIEHFSPDYKVRLYDIPNDTYADEWFMKNINASKAWETGCHGEGIRVGVIDSGVAEHNDIVKNLVEGYNVLNDTTDTSDTLGHGTFVSGIIAAEANNSVGLAGVAYNAEIVPIKCFENNETDSSWLIKAVYTAVDKADCRVLNISAGVTDDIPELKEAIMYAINKGVIVVAASGNHDDKNYFNKPNYPASYEYVVSVGAVDKNNIKSYFSNYNEYVDIVAPGSDVWSLKYDDPEGYKKGSGTSYAVPFVAAAAAVCLNVNPDITPSDFLSLLEQTALDLGDEGKDIYYGYGLLDMQAMLDKLLEGMEFFISPFDFESSTPSAVVYNNTDSDTSVFSIWRQEENTSLKKISLNSKKGTKIYFNPSETDFSHYLWSLNLKPLAKRLYSAQVSE